MLRRVISNGGFSQDRVKRGMSALRRFRRAELEASTTDGHAFARALDALPRALMFALPVCPCFPPALPGQISRERGMRSSDLDSCLWRRSSNLDSCLWRLLAA